MRRSTTPIPQTIAVVSGHFNPLHVGHLELMEAAHEGADILVAIVNNDEQQQVKKGFKITAQHHRLRLVQALRVVDEAFVAVDSGPGVGDSLRSIRARYPQARIVFCNGGDRRNVTEVPEHESRSCAEADIEMRFGVGGTDKLDSSSRIVQLLAQHGLAGRDSG